MLDESRDARQRPQIRAKYHPGHVWRLLGALEWTLQRPAKRAKERNEAAIEHWKQRPPVRRTWAPRGETPVLIHAFNWKKLSVAIAVAFRWDFRRSDLCFETRPGSYNDVMTDIVGSTETAARLGDRAWRDVLEAHHGAVRAELGRFGGREVDTAGDGFLATFDGPARAIRCAEAILDCVRALRLDVRIGLHAGECELIAGKIGGIGVHIGARVAAHARPGEVLTTSTVKDLVVGSSFQFADHGVTVAAVARSQAGQ